MALTLGRLVICGVATASALAAGAEAPVPWAAIPAGLLATRLPVAGDGSGPGWALRATAFKFEAADAVPVRAFSGDWSRYAPQPGRNAALQVAGIEVAAVHQGWELTTLARSEVVITGSRGAWDLVHLYKQRQTPVEGSEFSVQAQETGIVWAGLRVAQSWVLVPGGDNGLQITGALSLLSVRKLQTLDAMGHVNFGASSGFGFDAQGTQQDTRRQFGGYGQRDTTGSGYTFDLGLMWRLSADTFVNLAVADVVSRLSVRAVATQQATVSSATAARDSQGYIEYRPLLTGRYAATDVRLQLNRKWSATFGVRLPGWIGGLTAGVRWEQTAGIDLPALWASVPLSPGLQLQLDSETRFRSLGVGLRSEHGALMLRASSLPAGRSQALGGYATLWSTW